jgi:hypothetical protein
MALDNKSGVDNKITEVIDTLLKEVTLKKKDAEGKKMYSLTDVIKVVDRKLKLEALRLHVRDDGFGSGFDDPPETPEPEETP